MASAPSYMDYLIRGTGSTTKADVANMYSAYYLDQQALLNARMDVFIEQFQRSTNADNMVLLLDNDKE